MAEQKEEKAQKAAPSGPSKLAGLMPVILTVLNLGVLGGGSFLVYISTLGYHAPQITEKELETLREEKMKAMEAAGGTDYGPVIFTMDKLTANLDGEPKKSVRIEVNLEMLGKDGLEEIMSPDVKAKARDKVLRLLNDKNFAELESIQGKLFLKERIVADLNSLLDKGIVKDVYFSEFVMQ